VVRASPALPPIATLPPAVVKPARALFPIATLLPPELCGRDVVPPLPASAPTNVFELPVA